MRSALCASAPSHPLHAMPPRRTRNSDRPRASDRTMVDIVLLAASCTLELDHQQQRNLTRMEQQAKPLQGNETEWAGSRERFSSSRQGGAFFLTSLFIELIDSGSEGSCCHWAERIMRGKLDVSEAASRSGAGVPSEPLRSAAEMPREERSSYARPRSAASGLLRRGRRE